MDYVNNDDQLTRKAAIPKDKFLDLINLVLTATWYTFDSQFYKNKLAAFLWKNSILNHSGNLYDYSLTHCNIYSNTPPRNLGTIY